MGSLDFNKLESHHIFPISKFEKTEHKKAFWNDWGDGSPQSGQRLGNHLLNRAWIKKTSNNKISNSDPVAYLPKIDKKRLESQGVPTGENSLYNYEKYHEFIMKRAELQMAQLNSVLTRLWSNKEPEEVEKPSAEELISGGESQRVEFKSSFQWCYNHSKRDKYLVHDVVRAICGMLNSGGGNVFVGVDDDENVLGLAEDLGFYKNDRDLLDRAMRGTMKSNISPPKAFQQCVTPIEVLDNKGTLQYYHFEIDGYHQDVKQKNYRNKKKNIIWIRHGKSTEEIDEEE